MAILGPKSVEKHIWNKNLLLKTILILIIYVPVLCLFLGSCFGSPGSKMDVYIVDLDGDIIGNELVSTFQIEINSSSTKYIRYTIFNPLNIQNKLENAVNMVRKDDIWVLIVALPNSTVRLKQLMQSTDIKNDPSASVSVVYDKSRDYIAITTILLPEIRNVHRKYTASSQKKWIMDNSIGQMNTLSPSILKWNESSIIDVKNNFAQNALQSYVLVSFLILIACVQLTSEISSKHSSELLKSTMAFLRLRLLLFFSTILSIFSCIILSCFMRQFTAKSWFLLCLTMLMYTWTSAIFLFLPTMIKKPKVISLVLYCAFSLSAIAAITQISLVSPFYKWSYVVPSFNLVWAGTNIYYGVYHRVYLSVLALSLWFIFGSCLFGYLHVKRGSRLLQQVDEITGTGLKNEMKETINSKDIIGGHGENGITVSSTDSNRTVVDPNLSLGGSDPCCSLTRDRLAIPRPILSMKSSDLSLRSCPRSPTFKRMDIPFDSSTGHTTEKSNSTRINVMESPLLNVDDENRNLIDEDELFFDDIYEEYADVNVMHSPLHTPIMSNEIQGRPSVKIRIES